MPSTFVPLEEVLHQIMAAPDPVSERERLIELLGIGNIQSSSGLWVKANLDLKFHAQSFDEVVEWLPILGEGRDAALEELSHQAGPIFRTWAYGEYYTIRRVRERFEAYSYGDLRYFNAPTEIDPGLWKIAWVDEYRHALLCDDLANLQRREFMFVSLLRADVERLVDIPKKISLRKPRGRPKEYEREPEVLAAAHRILLQQPTISATRLRDLLQGHMSGPKPETTTYNKLYGYLFKDHRKSQKFKN